MDTINPGTHGIIYILRARRADISQSCVLSNVIPPTLLQLDDMFSQFCTMFHINFPVIVNDIKLKHCDVKKV